MPEGPVFERLLKRDRAITLAGLALLCVLAWLYLLQGAGLGMSAREMTTLSLFPHRTGAAAMAPVWDPRAWALVVGMWWAMMVAMMAPSAAPTILLYARVHRAAAVRGQVERRLAPTGAFAAGYLLVWLGFSIAAAALQWRLERAGLVSVMAMGSQSRWLSAAALIAVGLYQVSPLKGACLAHCRAPAAFLARHWRPGPLGAARLGVLHGAYCVGCCWMLMALLFVGGVMNLAWIAALAFLVLAEKAFPGGRLIGRLSGAVLVAWGLVTLVA